MATNVQQFLEQNPGYFAMPNTEKWEKPKEAPKSKKGSGSRNPLTALISEGGAGLGAAIGTLLLPGVGTAIGAGLGGFGGRLAENQIRDKEMRVKDALVEGGLSAALSGVGEAFKAAKGAKAVKAMSKAGIADDVARTATKTANMGRLQTAGLKIKSVAKGYGIGSKTSMNKGGLSFNDVAEVDDFIKRYGIKGKTPTAIDTTLSKSGVVEKIGAQLGKEYTKSGVKFTPDELKTVAKSLKDEILSSTSFDRTSKANMRYLNDLVKKFTSSDDAAKMFNFKSTSSLGIKDTGASDKLVDRELMLRAFRKKATELLDDRIKPLASLNKDYSIGKELLELSKSGAREAQKATGSVIAAVKQGAPGRAVQSSLGGAVQSAGRVTNSEFGKQIVRQSPASLYSAMGGSAQEMPQEMPIDPTMQEAPMAPGMVPQSPLAESMAMPTDDLRQQIAQAMTEDLQRTGGKNIDKLEKYYEFMSAGQGQQELTAVQRNKIAGYQTANTVVDQLENLWGGVTQPESQMAAGFAGLPGVKQARSTFNAPTRRYVQFAEGTVAPIIKSLGETGVLTDRDIQRALGLIPNLQDSPQVAQNKIMSLRMLLDNAQAATQDTGGGYGLDSALMEYGVQ